MTGRLLCMCCIVLSSYARQVHIPVRQQANSKSMSCYAQLEMTKDAVYQKEPVPFQCYFYGPRDQVSNACLACNEHVKHMYVYPQPHIVASDNMCTWTWSGVWYPQSPDDDVFPCLYINFEKERRRKGRSGMFGSLWGGVARENKQIDVDGSGQRITVWPLPDDVQVDGVGTFGTCQWVDVPPQVVVGKSYEVRLQLAGVGNFPYIDALPLGEQDGVRWFYVGDEMEHPVHAYQRTYAYAFYVTKPGTYTIDVPAWRIFDPQSEHVYTCKPDQLTFVAYGNAIAGEAAEDTAMPEASDATNQEQDYSVIIPWVRYIMIPFHWFLGFTLTPIVIGIGSAGWQSWCAYYQRTYTWWHVKWSFRHARRVLRQRNSSSYHVYRACMQVFQSLAQYTGIQEDIVERHIAQYCPEQIDDWRYLWDTVVACAFQHDKQDLDVSTQQRMMEWMRTLYTQWKSQSS